MAVCSPMMSPARIVANPISLRERSPVIPSRAYTATSLS
ncbi:Uncharacterised protein [Vibrio cholerae]|nr:Uncharacterised protein [Vibrio cholerae]